jgi:hypothetical protein
MCFNDSTFTIAQPRGLLVEGGVMPYISKELWRLVERRTNSSTERKNRGRALFDAIVRKAKQIDRFVLHIATTRGGFFTVSGDGGGSGTV